MKLLLAFIMLSISFSFLATNDITYAQKIQNSASLIEKELIYLEWVSKLSQKHTKHCDSILKNKDLYVSQFSDDAKLSLFVIHLNNSRLGGSINVPDISKYNLKHSDDLLIRAIVKCFQKRAICGEEYKELKRFSVEYKDPLRKSLFNGVLTCLVDIDTETKIKHFKTAAKFAKKSDLIIMTSAIQDVISLYYLDIEDFKTAIQSQQEGLLFARQHKLTANTISHLMNIGLIHFKLGNVAKAKESYYEAQKLSKNLGLDFLTGQLYNYLGELFSMQNNLSQSISYYKKSLIKFYGIKNVPGLASVHKNIGKAYFENGDIDLAKNNYELSLELNKEILEPEEKGELFYFLAELYLKKKQLDLAEFNILKAIEYWDIKNQFIPLNQSYLLYAQIKKERGDVNTSNEYLKKYIKFSDSFHKLETEKKVAELSELFKSEQKERKIAEQEKKIEEELSQRIIIQNQLQYSNEQNKLVLIILIISLILFAAIFVIIRTRNKQEQLKKKQKEIELQQTLLRSQMNPHFIFNAMTVIQSYIYDEDIANSSKFLVHFSKLMRLILENNTKEFIQLEKEREIINRYLVIQKMRFENRFDFIIEDNEIIDHSKYSVPPMFVQPFIENAIEHGDLDTIENGLIRIHCELLEDLFIFTIEDNGVGRKAAKNKTKITDPENHRSMAIELTQERIALLNEKHKGKGYLRIEDLDKENETGTRVIIATPFIKNF